MTIKWLAVALAIALCLFLLLLGSVQAETMHPGALAMVLQQGTGTPPSTETPSATETPSPTSTRLPTATRVKWTHGIEDEATVPNVTDLIAGFFLIPAVTAAILGVFAITIVVLAFRHFQRLIG